MEHIRPTIKIRLSEALIDEAINQVFEEFVMGTLELDALVHFVLKLLPIAPSDYSTVVRSTRNYIMTHYRIEQGPLRPPQEIHLRYVIVKNART